MGGGRGVVRRSKQKPRHIEDLTPEDIAAAEAEPLDSLTDRKVRHLESKAVSYLEEELRILTSTPGNFSEVARILKILKDHQAGSGGKGKGKGNATIRSDTSDQVKSWSLDD